MCVILYRLGLHTVYANYVYTRPVVNCVLICALCRVLINGSQSVSPVVQMLPGTCSHSKVLLPAEHLGGSSESSSRTLSLRPTSLLPKRHLYRFSRFLFAVIVVVSASHTQTTERAACAAIGRIYATDDKYAAPTALTG